MSLKVIIAIKLNRKMNASGVDLKGLKRTYIYEQKLNQTWNRI